MVTGPNTMKTALTASMTSLALQLRKTPTWDRGTELAGHADFTLTTVTQYLLKGTDLSRWDVLRVGNHRRGTQ